MVTGDPEPNTDLSALRKEKIPFIQSKKIFNKKRTEIAYRGLKWELGKCAGGFIKSEKKQGQNVYRSEAFDKLGKRSTSKKIIIQIYWQTGKLINRDGNGQTEKSNKSLQYYQIL